MFQRLKSFKYGDIECMVKYPFNKPTKETFESWKKDFLKIEEVKLFDIYVVGSFSEKLSNDDIEAKDIDIVLIGDFIDDKLEKLIYEGTKLGIEKYNTFFDILWFSELPIYSKMEKNETLKIEIGLISPELIVNGFNRNKPIRDLKQIRKNLWKTWSVYPTPQQLSNINNGFMYKDPVLIS